MDFYEFMINLSSRYIVKMNTNPEFGQFKLTFIDIDNNKQLQITQNMSVIKDIEQTYKTTIWKVLHDQIIQQMDK